MIRMPNNEKFCDECQKPTRHDYCKDLTQWYWRCQDCLKREVKHIGVFTPPHTRIGTGNRRTRGIHAKQRDLLAQSLKQVLQLDEY